jgi:hypothetical protein
MSSMLDYHTHHLSLPARGHGEGGDQVFIAFCGVSCGLVRIAQGDALCLAGLCLASSCGRVSGAFCVARKRVAGKKGTWSGEHWLAACAKGALLYLTLLLKEQQAMFQQRGIPKPP